MNDKSELLFQVGMKREREFPQEISNPSIELWLSKILS